MHLIWVTGVYKSPKLKKIGPRFCIQDLVSCRKTGPRIVPHRTSYCAALDLVLCRNCETNGKGPRIVPHWTSYHATTESAHDPGEKKNSEIFAPGRAGLLIFLFSAFFLITI